MRALSGSDADWRGAKTWSLVFYAGDELYQLQKAAYTMFISENALNPAAFPSLKRFEAEVLAMASDLFHGKSGDADAVGSMTSGGTESLLMAVKTARDLARAQRPEVTAPEMVMPVTAHPALLKAAHYFDVRPVRTPVRADCRADLDAFREAVGRNTILAVGSAPQYPHGVVDPIEEMSEIARAQDIPFHVDACLGGYLLPWVKLLGRDIPPFDFELPGVTSISADLHKYGFAAKGASTIFYRNRDLRMHQFFAVTDWPGGMYGSPTMTGTRPGGAIAAAWAVMKHLGKEGYTRLAAETMRITDTLVSGISSIDQLEVISDPEMSVFAFMSHEIDVMALATAMYKRGWRLDRQQLPDSLHMMVTPNHAKIIDPFIADLSECVAAAPGEPEGVGFYGAAGGSLTGDKDAKANVLAYLDGLG